MSLSLAYNFNGGRHLNRPINANTTRGDLLVRNWQVAIATDAARPGVRCSQTAAASGPAAVGADCADELFPSFGLESRNCDCSACQTRHAPAACRSWRRWCLQQRRAERGLRSHQP